MDDGPSSRGEADEMLWQHRTCVQSINARAVYEQKKKKPAKNLIETLRRRTYLFFLSRSLILLYSNIPVRAMWRINLLVSSSFFFIYIIMCGVRTKSHSPGKRPANDFFSV